MECRRVLFRSAAFTMEMSEGVLTVKTQTSTPLSAINYFKWELIGVAVPTDFNDSYVEFSGASATSVPVGTQMEGLPFDVTGSYGLPVIDLQSVVGVTFNDYDVLKLRLTVKTTEGCTSTCEILFDIAGDYYNYTLLTSDVYTNSTETADCGCGCGCADSGLCECVTLTDETNYGGTNPARSAYEVTFAVYKVDSNLTETLMEMETYDPDTVTSVTAQLDGDGWYKLEMNVKTKATGFVTNVTQNVVVTCAAWKKYNTTLSKLTCGNNDDNVVLALAHLQANLSQVDYLWCLSDYRGAEKIIECINAIDTGCGCGDC